jgi:dihydroflavonol-4-reductase
MRVFVTGSTGFLGNNVVRQLSADGHSCLALVRTNPPEEVFADTNTTCLFGDLDQQSVLDQGIAECDVVIHSAALIHLGWRQAEASMRVNQKGTRNIVQAALRHRKRLVHIGTVNTMVVGSQEAPANEETPHDGKDQQVPCSYVISKRASVAEVHAGVQQGLSAAIIHPGFMLGPWDWKPSSGRMILELASRTAQVYPSGGVSLCDARDVAGAAVAAITLGGDSGREFICAGYNWTYQRLWTEIRQRLGRRAPPVRLGRRVGRTIGWITDLWSAVTKHEGDINSASIRMGEQYHWYDSQRAETELGYRNRPAEETLDDAVHFLVEQFKR